MELPTSSHDIMYLLTCKPAVSRFANVSSVAQIGQTLPDIRTAMAHSEVTSAVRLGRVGATHRMQFECVQIDRGRIDFGNLRSSVTRVGEIDLRSFRLRENYRGLAHLAQQMRIIILIFNAPGSIRRAQSR